MCKEEEVQLKWSKHLRVEVNKGENKRVEEGGVQSK